MKTFINKIFICTAALIFSLSSCNYSPASLPDHFVSNYEIVMPIADIKLSFNDIVASNSPLPIVNTDKSFRAGTEIPYYQEFPFYVADLSDEGKTIEWIEPKIIITDGFLEKADVFISFYIVCSNSDNYALVRNKKLVKGENIILGTKESRISPKTFESLSGANKLFMQYVIIPKEEIRLSDVSNYSSHIKVGLKMMVTMGFSF